MPGRGCERELRSVTGWSILELGLGGRLGFEQAVGQRGLEVEKMDPLRGEGEPRRGKGEGGPRGNGLLDPFAKLAFPP